MQDRVAKSAREIFVTFTRIGASGFGGVNFWIRRVLVQEKRWITDREYLEGLALGRVRRAVEVEHRPQFTNRDHVGVV